MKWPEAGVKIVESFNSRDKSGHALAAFAMLLLFLLLIAALIGAGGHEAIREAWLLLGK